jgi:hypothetical protein
MIQDVAELLVPDNNHSDVAVNRPRRTDHPNDGGKLRPMQKSNVVLALTPREADFLEDLLDDQSYRMGCARKPGAGPSRKEKLLNSITEKLIYAAANARPEQ